MEMMDLITTRRLSPASPSRNWRCWKCDVCRMRIKSRAPSERCAIGAIPRGERAQRQLYNVCPGNPQKSSFNFHPLFFRFGFGFSRVSIRCQAKIAAVPTHTATQIRAEISICILSSFLRQPFSFRFDIRIAAIYAPKTCSVLYERKTRIQISRLSFQLKFEFTCKCVI